MFRRFSLRSFVLLMLVGLATVAAWRPAWLPLELGGTPTGSIVNADMPSSESESPPEFASDEALPFETDQRLDAPLPDPPRLQLSNQNPEESAISRQLPQAAAGVLSDEGASLDDHLGESLAEFRVAMPTSRSRVRLIAGEQPPAASQTPAEGDASSSKTAAEEPAADPAAITEPPVRVAKRPKDQESAFDFAEIDRQIKSGQLVEAHQALSKLFWQQPDLRSRVQERIDLTAKALYFSPQPHLQEPYVVQAGDQLRKIAGRHHVPWQYLARLNRIDPKRLREGQKLKVIDGPFGVVITLRDFELTVHLRGQYVRSYPCCIGQNNSTPVGKFKVLNKVTNPQYTDPDGKVFAGGDPKNPLGTHWIDLGDSYGIHGTIDPDSIGKAESRGCVRLLNADVHEVYDLLETNSEVVIRP